MTERQKATMAMLTSARTIATELRTQASDIERAAGTIAAIVRDDHRSKVIDGPAWDAAEPFLRNAGIKVPSRRRLKWLT